MNKEKNHYVVVLKSATTSKYKSLEEIQRIDKKVIECVFYAIFDNTFKGTSNITDWYRYELIDSDGAPSSYKVGNFEIKHIDTDSGCTNFFGRRLSIFNHKNQQYYSYISETFLLCLFMYEEIIPLFNKLNENSENADDILKHFKSYSKLEEENCKLRSTIANIQDMCKIL